MHEWCIKINLIQNFSRKEALLVIQHAVSLTISIGFLHHSFGHVT